MNSNGRNDVLRSADVLPGVGNTQIEALEFHQWTYEFTCPEWRLFAQVDSRSELRPLAFLDPAPFSGTDLPAKVKLD